MLAAYIRITLLLELAAYAAIAEWLHFLYAWSYGALALAGLAAALLARLAMVSITTTFGLAAGARAPEHRLGASGVVSLVAREWRAVIFNNLLYLPWEAWALRRDPAPGSVEGVPILFVHGYFSNRGYFRPLVRALERRGIAPIHAPNFPAAFASIEDFVARLHAEIERIANGSRQPRLILVCHSMGGLAARAYLCRHGAGRIARLVTIASPHHGTLHARFGAGMNARQMQRGSRFLAEVCSREGERGPDCPVTSIYSPHDNLVAPQETSHLAWAKNVVLPGLGHLDILRSPRLAQALLEELREAALKGPS